MVETLNRYPSGVGVIRNLRGKDSKLYKFPSSKQELHMYISVQSELISTFFKMCSVQRFFVCVIEWLEVRRPQASSPLNLKTYTE